MEIPGKHLLLAKGPWKIVDGTETLKIGASSQLEAEFKKNSQRAFSTIVLGMQSSQLYLITSTEEPIESSMGCLKKTFRERNAGKQAIPQEKVFPNGNAGRYVHATTFKEYEGVNR